MFFHRTTALVVIPISHVRTRDTNRVILFITEGLKMLKVNFLLRNFIRSPQVYGTRTRACVRRQTYPTVFQKMLRGKLLFFLFEETRHHRTASEHLLIFTTTVYTIVTKISKYAFSHALYTLVRITKSPKDYTSTHHVPSILRSLKFTEFQYDLKKRSGCCWMLSDAFFWGIIRACNTICYNIVKSI